MSPIVTTLVLAASLIATAVLALVRALSRAEPGYEDETGYHPGNPPAAPDVIGQFQATSR